MTAKGAIYKILQNSIPLSDSMFNFVRSLVIEDEINVPAMFSLDLYMKDFQKGEWVGVDLDTFKLGDVITIYLGYEEAEKMIVGEITNIEPDFNQESSILTLRGFDRLHRLRFGRFRRSFQEVKDSDLVKKIGVEAGLTVTAEDTATLYPYIFQNNETNYEFLINRVDRIGYELKVDDRELILRSSKEGDPPAASIDYSIDLFRFSAQLCALTEGSNVEVRGWNPKDKVGITGMAMAGDENSNMGGLATGHALTSYSFGETKSALVDERVIDDADASQIARGQFNTLLRKFLRADGQALGNPLLRAGNIVSINNIGKRFSGNYYINSSRHIYNRDTGYMTRFTAQRSGA